MQCDECGAKHRRNTWLCHDCESTLEGGVVFVTGISGTGAGQYLEQVEAIAHERHEHSVILFDVGKTMEAHAKMQDPDVEWDMILDQDNSALRFLRALAFQDLTHSVRDNPDTLHIVDLHLAFRWNAYLTRGFEPHLLAPFRTQVRCFVNLIEDLPVIKERLANTSWGEKTILELLIWRDEELFLTDLFADVCDRVETLALSVNEPPSELEKLIWHPEIRRVYLSFPITNILEDEQARREITEIRDRIREFLAVFDPYACKDYDETYERDEMKQLRPKVGDVTEERDYRFIDQADAVVVYFPRMVPSKGVDAEMNHARRTGKPIYLYSPEAPGGGPFAVNATHMRQDQDEFVELLRKELGD